MIKCLLYPSQTKNQTLTWWKNRHLISHFHSWFSFIVLFLYLFEFSFLYLFFFIYLHVFHFYVKYKNILHTQLKDVNRHELHCVYVCDKRYEYIYWLKRHTQYTQYYMDMDPTMNRHTYRKEKYLCEWNWNSIWESWRMLLVQLFGYRYTQQQ